MQSQLSTQTQSRTWLRVVDTPQVVICIYGSQSDPCILVTCVSSLSSPLVLIKSRNEWTIVLSPTSDLASKLQGLSSYARRRCLLRDAAHYLCGERLKGAPGHFPFSRHSSWSLATETEPISSELTQGLHNCIIRGRARVPKGSRMSINRRSSAAQEQSPLCSQTI